MHFCVSVITTDGDYDKALEPYSEHIKVSPYIYKTKDDLINEAKNDLQNAIKTNQSSWENYLKASLDWTSDKTLLESLKRHYQSYDCYSFDENNNLLSTYNPLSKWDWFVLGGRYSDYLKLKDKSRSNEAQIKDLDLSAYNLNNKDKNYFKRFWEINVEDSKLTPSESPDEYYSIYKKEYLQNQYLSSSDYVKVNSTFYTYALLFNNTWIDCDEFNNTPQYITKFYEVFDKLDPNYHISIVDCHI